MRLDDLASTAESISRNAKFPITSADQLVQAVGGDNATVHGHKASEARQIPASYFPIDSQEDLMTKLSALVEGSGEQIEGVQWGKTGGKAPASAGSPPKITRSAPRGVPTAKGFK
jgi:hypothetical protein